MKYVDVHAHLNEDIFNDDRNEIVADCSKKKIVIINCSGTHEGNVAAIKMVKKYKDIKLCLGIYPVQCAEMTDSEFSKELNFIKENADKLVGIGEVGLDYYWIKDNEKRNIEVDRFKEIIWLANKLKLPLNVHTRGAGLESVTILAKTAHVPVVLHAFGEDLSIAELGIKNGFYFSIPPNVIYNKKRQKLVEMLPLGRILTETDCPYLGPEPDKRNDPRNVSLSVKKISEIKKISEKEVAKIIVENTKTVFRI